MTVFRGMLVELQESHALAGRLADEEVSWDMTKPQGRRAANTLADELGPRTNRRKGTPYSYPAPRY